MSFIVVSGKLESHNGEVERNYSYISEEFADLADAIKDLENGKGYAFNEIEYTAPDGKRYVVHVDPIIEDDITETQMQDQEQPD